MFRLTPAKTEFYDHFDRAAELIVQAAGRFRESLEDFHGLPRSAEALKGLEHQLDEVVHQVMTLLHNSFITPLERGDIRRLVQGLDSILDGINAASSRMALYEIEAIPPEVSRLADNLIAMAEAVQQAVAAVRNLRRRSEILEQCVRINHLEDEGDRMHREALVALFKSGQDPLAVIKWKEIYEFIEAAADCCEEVADIVEGIVLENA
jgi:predicted phosphate transport protein (TIGR00153 family)